MARWAILAGLLLAIYPTQASASVLTLELDFEFSGGVDPGGATPWLVATFDDSFGGANTVRLTMSAANLTGSEFAEVWLFNFDPALNPGSLSIAAVDISAVHAPNTSETTGTDAFMADGDGLFDIKFDFPPPPGNFDKKFTSGEVLTYDLTYISPITASSFDFPSVMGGGGGTFRSAAHVQGIDGVMDPSGWIGDGSPVPEPASLWLFGLVALAARRSLYRVSR